MHTLLHVLFVSFALGFQGYMWSNVYRRGWRTYDWVIVINALIAIGVVALWVVGA